MKNESGHDTTFSVNPKHCPQKQTPPLSILNVDKSECIMSLTVGRRAEVRLQRSGALLQRCAVFPLEITCYYSRYVLTQ